MVNRLVTTWWRSAAVIGLAALTTAFAAVPPVSGQSTSGHERILRQFQPRGMQALHRTALSKAATTKAVILKQRQYHAWNGTGWDLQGQSVFTYDGARRTEQWDYVWTGASWQNTSRTIYMWMDEMTLTETMEEYRAETQSFEAVERYIHRYYNDFPSGTKELTSTTTVYMSGGQWLAQERVTYTGEDVTIAAAMTETWVDNDWAPVDRYAMENMPFGVRQTYEAWTGADWEQTERTEYFGVQINEIYELGNELLATFTDYGFLLYGMHRWPPYATQMWDGAEWIYTDRTVALNLEPDPVNGLTFSGFLYQLFENGEFVDESRMHTTHKSDGKPVLITVAYPNGDAWETSLSEEYSYDSRNDVTRATQSVDFGGGLEQTLQYRLTWEHLIVGVEDYELPDGYALDAAYPNPFNPATTVTYRLAAPGHVSVRAYDALGRGVATLFEGNQTVGTHRVTFNAGNLSSGVYLIRMEAPDFKQSRSVTLLK